MGGERCDAMLFRERRPSSLVAETGNSKPLGFLANILTLACPTQLLTTHDLHGYAVAFWFRANVARLWRATSLMGLVRLVWFSLCCAGGWLDVVWIDTNIPVGSESDHLQYRASSLPLGPDLRR